MYVQILEIFADILNYQPITDGIIILFIAIAIKFFYKLAGVKR